MQKEGFANQPLLYIDQKERKSILANMQADYFTSHSLNYAEETKAATREGKEQLNSIIERIRNALATSEHVPNIKYTIETKEETYRAIIQAYENENLSIVDERGVMSSIPISSIKNIEAISL